MGELELRAIAMALVTFAPKFSRSINSLHHGQPRVGDRGQQTIVQDAENSSPPFIGIVAHRHDISIRAQLVPREENCRADPLSQHQCS